MTNTYHIISLLSFLWILSNSIKYLAANHDAKRLYDDLLKKKHYNKIVRPVGNNNTHLIIYMGLRLAQLLDVDERNQIISLNVWLLQEWVDDNLSWKPHEYGHVTELFLPADAIWVPDIVMYNNADGDYTVTLMTKAALEHTGKVSWEPPAIYKSHCEINVEYFPFDEQDCFLKFGSWSYDGQQVDLRHIWHTKYGPLERGNITIERAIDFKQFYRHVEWDLIDAPARKNDKYYPCCPEAYPDITFNFTLRRRTLFYTINLIIPCFSINMLTILGFYLPCDCGEKISLCISILLSLSIFQLLLLDIVPPTSVTIPLIGKYLLFTCIMVSLSVFFSVVVLNIRYRSCPIQQISNCTRKIFLEVLPGFLLMRKPTSNFVRMDDWTTTSGHQSDNENFHKRKFRRVSLIYPLLDRSVVHGTYGGYDNLPYTLLPDDDPEDDFYCKACARRTLGSHLQGGIESVMFYSKHIQDCDDTIRVKEEWKYLALVIDRILLWIYVSVCTVGAVTILMNAPVLYDRRAPITGPEDER